MTKHTPKFAQEFGRNWHVETPRGDIHWLMGRVHVGTPDAEIEADIRGRCTDPAYTPEIVQEAVDYALICHRENQGLYRYVMTGSRSRAKATGEESGR